MLGVRLGASVGGTGMCQSLPLGAFQVFSAARPVVRVCLYHRQNDLGACIVQFFDQWAQFRRALDWPIGGDYPSARALRPL